jgi:hypothetical protein
MGRLRIYYASSMTGRSGKELVEQSKEVDFLSWCYEVEALDPIKAEHVKPTNEPLNNGGDLLRDYWKRDKEMIRHAHVVIDVTGQAKSEGVSHEIGYARYHLHRPVIRVWPNLGSSVARLEDDLIAESLADAIKLAVAGWGTPVKRLKWKWYIFKKSYLNLLKTRLVWFVDWI